jgi:hypothetical protein
LSVLATLKTSHASAVHLSSLKGLQMGDLEGVETLTAKHLRRNKDLSLRKLYKLRLSRVLEVANRTNGLVY